VRWFRQTPAAVLAPAAVLQSGGGVGTCVPQRAGFAAAEALNIARPARPHSPSALPSLLALPCQDPERFPGDELEIMLEELAGYRRFA